MRRKGKREGVKEIRVWGDKKGRLEMDKYGSDIARIYRDSLSKNNKALFYKVK